jgi:hypothetical protein
MLPVSSLLVAQMRVVAAGVVVVAAVTAEPVQIADRNKAHYRSVSITQINHPLPHD